MKKFEGFQKGINLGGWISQYASFDEKHFESYIMEKDIKSIADMGFDHVRVPVDYPVLENEDGSIRESGFSYLSNCLNWCKKYGLHMLIDLHETYGYSFDPLKKDMDREIFFKDDALQERFFQLWMNIAKRFGNESDSVAFELLNEIVLPSVSDAWNEIVAKAVKRIRTVAPDNYIVFGGVNYNNVRSVPLLAKPEDDKIVFNFHCYDPLIFTHQKAYWIEGMPSDFTLPYPDTLERYRKESELYPREMMGAIYAEEITSIGPEFFDTLFHVAIEAADKADVPLYCGEYGVIELAPMEDALRWYTDIHSIFEKYNIGRAMWNYKGKDFGLVDSYYAPIKDCLVDVL